MSVTIRILMVLKSVSILYRVFLVEQHRGFAFVEFELQEDAAAAIDNMVSKYHRTNNVEDFISFS